MSRDPAWRRRGELAREGVVLAERLGDDVARVRCQAMVLESVARHGSQAEALPDALRTLADAERVGDPRAIAPAHHTVARCFDAQDCTSEALEHVHKGLDGYRAAGDIFGEGRMLSLMAWLFWQLGEPERARPRPRYEQAHDIFLDCDDPSGAGVMLACVAGILCEGGAAAEAATTCERALESFEQAGMPLDSVIAMRHYAHALSDLGQYDLATLWAKRGLERNRMPDGTLANPEYEVDLLLVLARSVQLPVGELREARATLERALALATELAYEGGAGPSHGRAGAAQRRGRPAQPDRPANRDRQPAPGERHPRRPDGGRRPVRHATLGRCVRYRPVQGHQRPVRS